MRQLEAQLINIITLLFKRYPYLFDSVNYFFIYRNTFFFNIISRVTRVLFILETQYPSVYRIIIYFYIQFVYVSRGIVSKLVAILIGCLVIYDPSAYHVFRLTVLSSNAYVKE